ncbi:MAG: hypothetical protein V3V01_17815 [Acidimicrobiales bacterium]
MGNPTLNRMAKWTAATVMFMFEAAILVEDGANETDVIYETENNLPGGAAAATICDDDSPGGNVCDSNYIQYNIASIVAVTINNPNLTLTQERNMRRMIACHELGHSLGLVHGENAFPILDNQDGSLKCMRTPTLANGSNSGSRNPGAHNKEQINGHY